MSRRPARVTQADIARALRAADQTGMKMAVEIDPDGTIRLVPLDAGQSQKTKKSGVEAPREIVL